MKGRSFFYLILIFVEKSERKFWFCNEKSLKKNKEGIPETSFFWIACKDLFSYRKRSARILEKIRAVKK